ncbi:MAG: hypothetical protein QOJ26_909, partial [Thermoplasmata archaeon]|nr:hypothetical protein [Thermoplasmata archaeon]
MPPVEEFETTCPNCKKDFDVRSDDVEVSCPHCDARVRLVEPAGPAPAPAPYVPPAPRPPVPTPHAPELRRQAAAPVAAKPAPAPAPAAVPYVPPAPPKVVVKAPPEPIIKPVKVPPAPIVAEAKPSKPMPTLRELLRIAQPDETLLEARAREAKAARAAKEAKLAEKAAEKAAKAKAAAAEKAAKAKAAAADKAAKAEAASAAKAAKAESDAAAKAAKAKAAAAKASAKGEAKPAEAPDTGGRTGLARLNFLTRRERTPLDSDEAVPILEIEGVGPAYAQKLQKAGIVSSDDLLGRDLKVLAKKTGIETRELQKWQDMADLIHVKGIGPQFAEVLVRCDINSVAELARQEPKPLATKIQAFLDSKQVTIVDTGISAGRTKAWIKEARKLAPPPADVGRQALKAVRGKPEPAEEVTAKPARKGTIDDKKLAEDAKKDAERGFLTRFARRNVADVPTVRKARDTDRTTISTTGGDMPVARRSLFRRDPEAAARRAEMREAAQSQKQKDAEAKAKAKAAADAAKGKDRDAAAKAKAQAAAEAKAQRESKKAAERRLAEERKAKDVAARNAAKAAKPDAPPLAAEPRKGLPFLSRSPLETVDCAHCGHKFSVKASQRKATCPSCHSVLALVGEGEAPPAVAVKAPAGKPAPTPTPILAATPPAKPAKAAKPAKGAKSAPPTAPPPTSTGAALLADSKAEPAGGPKAQKLLAKQAALEGSRSKDEAAKNAKAEERAAAG